MRKTLISILFSTIATLAVSLPLMAEYAQQKEYAERYYASGDYSNAHKSYKELARKGDSYSQYRLSYMYLMGEGKKEDLIESVAWSVLAAQDKQEEKIAYMKTVAEMVPQDQRKKADKKISYYMRKFGNASDSDSGRSDKECTGSRLCNHKTTSGNVGVPSYLWNVGNNDNSQQDLIIRVQDINDSILRSEAG